MKKKVFMLFTFIVMGYMTMIHADTGSFFSDDSDWGGGFGGGSYDYGGGYDGGRSYDWGSSHDSSFWGSSYDNDWSSSEWDSNDYQYREHKPLKITPFSILITLLICAIVAFYMFREMGLFGLRKKKPGFNPSGRYEDNMPEYIPNYNGNLISDAEEYAIVYAIQNRDEFFDRDNFLAYAQKVFISLQKAWSNQELKTIQYYENVDLYEQHLQQLKQYKDKGEKNVVEMILVRNVEFLSLKEDQGKDVLSVVLTCSMIDYIKNEKTGKIVFGDDKSRINRMYQMTFVRDKSAKTSQKGVAEKEVECPNCGAHSMIKYSKECKYCGTFLKIAENDWMLSNLEPFVIEKRKNK